MTATQTAPTVTVTPAARPSLWKVGLVAAALAAAATEAFTAIVRTAGVHLAIGNIGGTAADVVQIGPGACSIMVAICVALGLGVAAGLNRWATRPTRTFMVSACVLTGLSFVPDVFAGATATSSKLTLMVAHVIAAVIVIPLVARSLRD